MFANNNNNNQQQDPPYTPSGDPSLWYLSDGAPSPQPGQIGAVPPSLFKEQDLEEGSIVGFEDDVDETVTAA